MTSTIFVALRWLGLWKWDNERNGSYIWLKRSYPFILHLPLTFTNIALMWLQVITSSDLEEVFRVLYMSITEVPLLIKIINIWYRREEAYKFVEELVECASRSKDMPAIEQEIYKFHRAFYLYIGGSLTVGITGYVSVFFQEDYVLPFSYYVPFEWHTPRGYFYAWSYNVLAMSLCCVSNVLLDSLGCYFMLQIGLLYKSFNLQLVALQHATEQEALPQLRNIFKLHKKVHQLKVQCEKLISPYVLSQVTFSAFIICFSGYRLVEMGWQQNPGLFVATLQFETVMIVQIFMPCYYGNQLTIHADQLTNSVYHTNWLGFSVATRKELICFMEFFKKPVKIRAGIFFDIGLPLFMKTINNAYSFFAVLLNLSK